MTGHTSDETIDVPQENRSTDSESATKFPTPRSGVVQDSPGNAGVGTADTGMLDEQGRYTDGDSDMLGAVSDEE